MVAGFVPPFVNPRVCKVLCGLRTVLAPSQTILQLNYNYAASKCSNIVASCTKRAALRVEIAALFGYAIGGHNILELRDKARELSEVMGYVDLEIGQALGILKQSNLIPTKH